MQLSTQAGAGNPGASGGAEQKFRAVGKTELLEERIQGEIKKAQADLETYTQNDQSYRRRDTVEVVKDIMRRVKEAASEINQQPEEVRERLYYLIYNATILIFKACHQLRVANFSIEATHFLAFNILCLDNNLILTTTKYLDWRVLNYTELARAYADFGALKAASKVISYGITKALYSKQVEEQDPPVPEGTKDTLIDALRVLRTQELKYELQSGSLSADAWRKKLEETFANNKYHRSLAIVECLQTNEPFASGERPRDSKISQIKADALKQAFELVKGDVELVKQALVQVHEKKKRDREKKDKLANRDPDVDLDELLDKYKQMDAEMIQEKDWKFAASCVPIEIHVELVKLTYECQLWLEFEALLDPALVRLKFRRYEVPYLATVDVLMSANKVANIPNGFEKLPKDLNQANLRIELKRLRATSKKGAGGKEEPKKEEAKKKEPAKDDKKNKKDPKAPQQPVEDDAKPADPDEIQATESELDAIQHVYVHMLLQRTKTPQNAVVGLDVVLADENLGPDLADNHFAVAVPIRQHPGAYEKAGMIPYVVFRRTANSLIDEEDSLSIITDVCVIQGQDPHMRAPLGFTRIDVDLRQTPKDLERVPNLDYVFVCYKTDRQLALAERDLLVLRRLAELEKSYVLPKSEEYKSLDEAKQFLGLQYNQDLLVDLSSTIKEALLGPLGDYYLEQRFDLLNEVTGLLWTKYLLPVLQKIDLYIEMRGQKEYFGEFVNTIDEAVIRIRHDFVDTLNIMHRILTRTEYIQDIVLYCKCSIFLANLQEEIGEFRNAVQALRAALGKVVEYREERMKRSLDSNSNSNPTTAMSITIDNRKIGELEEKMQTIYNTWEELILRKERDRMRKEQELPPLDEDEGDEEQLEVKQCIEELRNKDLFERDIDLNEWQLEHKRRTNYSDKQFFSETDQVCHALHVDILLNLYRCEIKLGKELDVVKRQTQDLLKTQGIDLAKNAPGNMTKNLSGKLTQKMSLAKSKTLSQNKGALKNLQQTLQEAGKMPPSKPQILSYEKILERENNQNPYQNALLYMALAMAKTNNVEQKSLLLEAVEFLKKARQSEDALSNLALDSAVYLKAGRCFHEYFGETPDQVHPFNLLAKPIYIKKTTVPVKPVMVCRTSTSITMKLPFFKPLTEYKAWRNISEVALYGKPSGSGVAVSLNNTDYPGTGEKKAPGGAVNVTGLIPNEKYVFAAGGYTPEGHCVNGIGETSNEILTLLPLSLHQLYGYLSEIAFKLGHYQIARQAAETLCQQFLIKNEFSYPLMDTSINPLLAFRLDKNYFSRISMVEAKQLAEAFVILAKVSKLVRNEVQRRADHRELQVEKQKVDMKIANFLCLALEISTYLNRPSLTKRVASELYNHLVPYFTMKMRPQILLHVLLKCHEGLRLIPAELIDSNTRRVLGCLSYQVVKLGQESTEDQMLRRVMISELPITSRKWRKYSQYVIQRPQLSEEEREKFEDQKKRMEMGDAIPAEELVKEPEPYEERLYKLDEFEDEGHAFEEFLLSIVDFQDVVKAKTEQWRAQIQSMQDAVSGGEETVTNLKELIGVKVDFWEQVKLNKPSAQLASLVAAHEAGNENPRFLEFSCKCIRRALETGDYESFESLAEKIRDGVKIPEEDEAAVENTINERIGYLQKDIVRKQRKRFDTLEQKVQQLLEQQSLTGGNNTLGPKKLQQLVSGDKNVEDDGKDLQVALFENDEEEQQKLYSYLWISERYSLLGMCKFLGVAASSSQRSQLEVSNQSCVFNDILQMDFVKYKQTLEEYQDVERLKKIKFEEEHKEDNEEYVVEIEDRIQKVTDLLQVMARAAEYAKLSKSWLQLVSIIRYTWNIFAYDLTNPLELTKGDGWQYVLLIAECSICLVEHLQKGGNFRKVAGRSIDEVKDQQPSFDKDLAAKSVAFKFDAPKEGVDGEAQAAPTQQGERPEKQQVQQTSKGPKWFETIDEFEVSLHASLIGFTVQSLMAVAKWESLVDISNRLNDATGNEFAAQLLPFIIFAQGTLHGEAAKRTKEKRKALEVRVQQFENWKLTSKKKRSRQAMLTGEIPPEEQEFNRDRQQLEKEIFRLDVIENVLLSDKRESDHLLENIKRDANNCVESLKACRKLYHQYGIGTQNLLTDEKKKGKNHFEIRSKRKGHKVFTTTAIGNYKKCIEQLRKRQEKFLLIQALHELGNLLYADGNLGEAEICWNDCVDTIFQRLYVVKQFRSVFEANASLADAFGSQQVLIGGIVLTKLAKLCYEGQDLHKYSECILMASELFAAPAKLSLPHPQVAHEYTSYTFREFMGRNFFTDQYILQPSELLNTLGASTQALIDDDLFEKALPLAALMEYLASDITRSKILTVKARLMRATALVELGYINEAFMIYKRILSLKDLPEYGARHSEFSVKQSGKNFQFPSDQAYNNHLPPEADENQAALKVIQDPVPEDIEQSLTAFCSPYLVESLHYLRSLLMVRLGQTENVENQEKAELRSTLLKTAEESLRASLRRVQFAEEVAHLKLELFLQQTKVVDREEDRITALKEQLVATFERGAVVEDRQTTYYVNTEEELCHADQRSQRLSLILRIRAALGRIQESQGLLLESFYIQRQGLSNFKALAEGQYREVEKGSEPESKGTFKLPDALAAASAPAAGGKKDKAPAKDAKAKAQAPDDAELKKAEEERSKEAQAEADKLRAAVDALERRSHPNMVLWLKTKINIISILLAQKRYEDCADAIAVTRLEASSVKDQLYTRKLQEIEFQIQVQSGDLREALRIAEEIRRHAKEMYQTDTSYCDFLGNLSELLYVQSKDFEARLVAEEASALTWSRLKSYGCEVDAQNINGSGDVEVWDDRKKATEEDLEAQLANVPAAAAATGAKGAPPAKGGAAKGAAPAKGVVAEEVEESTESSSLDFSKPVEYKLSKADEAANSSCLPPNIYLLGLETLIRLDLRYSQYLMMIEKKHEDAKAVLLVTDKLAARTLYLCPQLQFYQAFLLGHVNRQIFYDKVLAFQAKYTPNPKYKESFTRHVPFGSIALGHFMLELPNFSQKMQVEYRAHLDESERAYARAVQIAKAEAVVYEFDFTVRDALRGMAEVCFLISEYRSRVLTYKYASFNEQDEARKLERLREKKKKEAEEAGENDDLDDGLLRQELKEQGDKWDQEKADKEQLEVFNYRIKATKYLDAAVEVAAAQAEFLDKQHELAQVNLTDASKIPKEMISELFEASQVNKVSTSKLPDFEFKDKTTITSSELLAQTKAVVYECCMLTFGAEKGRLSKMISKLHRYLLANLSSYGQKCVVKVPEIEDLTEAAKMSEVELRPPGHVATNWFDFAGQQSSLFYILGPLDEQAFKKPDEPPVDQDELSEAQKREQTEIRLENKLMHFGKVEVDALVLSRLYQDTRDLIEKMKESEERSEAKNTRDRKKYKETYHSLVERLGNIFKPPITSEEEQERDVDCLALVKDLIPELSIDNVQKLADVLQKDAGCSWADPAMSAILRKFHRVRYIK